MVLVIQKDQVEEIKSILSASLNPSRQGCEGGKLICPYLGFEDNQVYKFQQTYWLKVADISS